MAQDPQSTADPDPAEIDDPTRFLARVLHLGDPDADVRIALSGRTTAGEHTEFSYARLTGSVVAAARVLAAAGVRPGDRVALVATYGPAWVAAFLGILAHGAVAVPLDPGLAADGLAPILRDADPTLVYVGPDTERQVEAALAKARRTRTVRLPMLGEDRPDARTLAAVPRQGRDAAVIAYTSGTTGAAKGVAISWAGLVYQVAVMGRLERVSPAAVFVSILPSYHLFELMLGCLAPLYRGSRIHYPGSMVPRDILAAVTEQRASDLVTVPLFLTAMRRRFEADLAREPRLRRAALVAARRLAGGLPFAARRFVLAAMHARLGGRLRRFYVGGAPLDPELAAYFERLGFQVCQGYGLTEASPTVSVNTPWRNRPGSVGRPLPGTQARIAADGEILVRGPGVMLGYWRAPELTATVLDDEGWLRTGDLGFIDADGYLFVTGRAKNLIVLANGQNVRPEDVESVILRSDLIGQVCVLGRPGPSGEEITAVVTASGGARSQFAAADREQAVIGEVRRLAADLAPYQRPSRIVVHDRNLPQTATHKVRRAAVEEIVRVHAHG